MSLHADAVQVLTTWKPPDGAQARLRDIFLAHLASRPDRMWRSHVPMHLTASTMVTDPHTRRVLLTLHSKARRWLQLGGHCELADRTIADAALREATEESGIAGLRLVEPPVLLVWHPVCCTPTGESVHLDVQYVAVAPHGAVPQISGESDDLRWFTHDRLPGSTDASVRRLVRMAMATV